ncbi:histidine kinase G7 [Cladophialophora carrionii]|uniref:Histidine kinase G7 n=1 Tax=Cladophialophora carrionii TaxID=86049 RepID=A0A1C1CX61_9EURO|nr:histidine kinase G7 [Cladophialophora carrionii]
MPVMDGMTATRLIRQYESQNSLPRVPIFALTGLASAAARNEALESGIDRLLTKPVPFDALAEILLLSQAPSTTHDKGHGRQT